MNLEYFIASRLANTRGNKSSVSAPIIKIAITAIAVGIVVMIISIATGIGLQNEIRDKVSSFNGHIIVSAHDDNQSYVSTLPISTKQEFYPSFYQVEGVKHIQAVATKAAMIRTEETVEGIIFKGVGIDYDWSYLKSYLEEGKLPNIGNKRSDEVVVSKFLANRLKLKLGDTCRTYFIKPEKKGYNLRSFIITGIFNSGFQEFDANFVIGDLAHIRHINKWQKDQVGSFEIFIDDFSKIQEKKEQVSYYIPSLYDCKSIKDKYYSIFEWLGLFDFNIIVVLLVMIVVSIVNITVALLVLILERTQFIGLLKSMGASNWSIRKIFLYNAFHIISRGLLYGNLLALGFLFAQYFFKFIKLDSENYYVNYVPVDINLLHIVLLNLGTILVILMVLLIPSYIITKITPVKAIKFD